MDLVTIATYGNPDEANIASNYLESEGIRSFVGDENIGRSLWHVGTALGGVKLQVAEEDGPVATQLLSTLDEKLSPGEVKPDWDCPKCNERIGGELVVCWNCGTAVDGTEDPQFDRDREPGDQAADEEHPIERPSDHPFDGAATASVVTPTREDDEENPYRSPRYQGDALEPPEEWMPPDSPDVIVARAWRASVIGIVLVACFPLLNLYSAWLLFGLTGSGDRLSPQGTRTYYFALAANALVIVAWLFIWLAVLTR